MRFESKQVFVCNCEGTMTIDGDTLAKACGLEQPLNVSTQLCRSQLENFERAARDEDKLLIACTQETPVFLETAAELGDSAAQLSFTNIRERAGWSSADPETLTPKLAALLSEAALDIKPTTSVSMASEGILVILGRGEEALDAAKIVSDRLEVSVILENSHDITPPSVMDVPVFRGNITTAEGHLGGFKISVTDYAPALPSSFSALDFTKERVTGNAECDLILDLRGATPLFQPADARDGYFHADPSNPAAVMKALFQLTDMVGEFEKPKYVDYDPSICAHARSGITGCTRCVDACATSAIRPDGDKVSLDPFICAGCGSCASVCPSGAVSYAMPAENGLLERVRTLAAVYRNAGGTSPVLLVHDTDWGNEMMSVISRRGRGLPANVLPFAVNSPLQVGLDFVLASSAYGIEHVVILVSPKKTHGELETLRSALSLSDAIFDSLGYGGDRVSILDNTDPEQIETFLHDLPPGHSMPAGEFLPMGRKRAIMWLALHRLRQDARTPVDLIELPQGAPFGGVSIDEAGCTLCLSCVGACPAGALKDNEDKPQLSFIESACIQCGLCKNTCPESVIALTPRLSFLESAKSAHVLKEEEPFECARCSKPFGTKATVEKMVSKLEGHSMFSDPAALERLKMCDDCRVISLAEADDNPLAHGTVPVTRTTDDYLREREEMKRQAAKDMTAKGLLPPEGEA